MKKLLKIVLLILLIAFIAIQFIKPAKNAGEEIPGNQISSIQPVPQEIEHILKTSCYDCHSNTTRYPWYNNIQPVGWMLHNHIVDAKKGLNFSEFATYPTYSRYNKFKAIQKNIKSGDMPLFSYKIIHRNAVLNASQKTDLINWAGNAMKEMESKYPKDSLVKPK